MVLPLSGFGVGYACDTNTLFVVVTAVRFVLYVVKNEMSICNAYQGIYYVVFCAIYREFDIVGLSRRSNTPTLKKGKYGTLR